MHSLRRFRWFACFMLAWWTLSLGVAAASPFVVLPSMERICSGAGPVQFLWAGHPDAAPADGHTIDCPLCMPTAAPAPSPVVAGLGAAPQAPGPCIRATAPRVAHTAAPLQARGPPVLLFNS
ncbi:MAG: DUF2946 domain-containing protein [Giesbergeria sp.]|jgi:hypothetical protein|nr:DUF2946 domain-containing protein [Giesbergeria sp.]